MKGPLLAALLVLTAGCTLPGDDEEGPALFGVCPQWIASEEVLEQAGDAQGVLNLTFEAQSGHQGRPLDMYLLDIRTEGPMRITAYVRDGERATFHEIGEDRLRNPPSLSLDGQTEVRVFLTAVEHGSAPGPGPLRLVFEGQGPVEVTATPFYRVCGVLLE